MAEWMSSGRMWEMNREHRNAEQAIERSIFGNYWLNVRTSKTRSQWGPGEVDDRNPFCCTPGFSKSVHVKWIPLLARLPAAEMALIPKIGENHLKTFAALRECSSMKLIDFAQCPSLDSPGLCSSRLTCSRFRELCAEILICLFCPLHEYIKGQGQRLTTDWHFSGLSRRTF
jgi:hypothetical protein